MHNPCLACGACCAHFRVSFYWAEAEVNGIPAELTVPVGGHRVAMRGTETSQPHCSALNGGIGEYVNCSIYDRRPSPCRSVLPSWQNGSADEQCDKARRAWGLPLLQPAGPTNPSLLPDDDLPRVA